MPTFSIQQPKGIADSIRLMLSSSPNPSAQQYAQADNLIASNQAHTALAEKYRAEVEGLRQKQANEASDRAFRENPDNALNYASTVSGARLPDVKQWDAARRGEMTPAVAALNADGTPAADQSTAFPAVEQPAPVIAPQVVDQIRSALASTMANRFATGKTNADQMTQAGGNLLMQNFRAAATNPDLAPAQRIANSEAITGKVVEPFKETASGGSTLNAVTGETADTPTEAGKLARALVGQKAGTETAHQQQLRAQAAASGAHAGLYSAQTDIVKGAGVAVNADGTVTRLPGGTGTHVIQQADSGDKFAFNEKTGNAWKATPDGTWKSIPINELPKNVGKIGAGGASQGSREAVFTQRVLTSANQAAKDLGNVVQLPLTASTGIFGGRKQGPGLFDAGREVLANKMTSQEAQSYNAMATGFQRSLAAIESAGLMPNGSLTHQMDAVMFKEGDTNLTKLHKLAQTRQIIESGLEVMEANPRVSDPEKEKIKGVLANVTKAVPFTHEDLINLEKSHLTKAETTINDVLKARTAASKPAATAASAPAAKRVVVDY